MEMSFVEQEDIFKIVEPIFYELFTKFGNGKSMKFHSQELLTRMLWKNMALISQI